MSKNTTTSSATINNGIIACINGKNATSIVKSARTLLEKSEKTAFQIAVYCYYAVGGEIPPYTDKDGNKHGKAVCENPISRKDMYELIGRSKATLSTWIKAIKYIIESNNFEAFNMGMYPFSYDKINIILNEDNKAVFKSYQLSELFKLSVTTLKDMLADDGEEADGNDGEEETNEETTNEDTIETIVLNGVTYKVAQSILVDFINKCEIVEDK